MKRLLGAFAVVAGLLILAPATATPANAGYYYRCHNVYSPYYGWVRRCHRRWHGYRHYGDDYNPALDMFLQVVPGIIQQYQWQNRHRYRNRHHRGNRHRGNRRRRH